ncbi:MAG: hypothetical protein ACRDLS_16890 [Solirubrobacteraceae bacterium]
MGYRLSPGRFVLLAATLLTFLLAVTAVAVPAHAQYSPPAECWYQADCDESDLPEEQAEPPADPAEDWPEPEPVLPPTVTTTTVAGKVAMLRADGKAAIPRGAPKRVRALIRHANRIIGKPYKWGGGHLKLNDRGYDCSGAVSFALIKARMLEATMVSGSFKRWAAAGEGRWISVYARRSHVYLEVAGLRLDTSPVGDITQSKGVRWRPVIGRRSGFTPRHPVRL